MTFTDYPLNYAAKVPVNRLIKVDGVIPSPARGTLRNFLAILKGDKRFISNRFVSSTESLKLLSCLWARRVYGLYSTGIFISVIYAYISKNGKDMRKLKFAHGETVGVFY